MSNAPRKRAAPARNGKVVRVAPTSNGKGQPLTDREARRQAVSAATKLFIELHREALKDLERY